MAKDPAMLWYWSDWHSGTITLSRFLKGCYMDVLHAQFNSGHLTLEEIKTVLGSDFGTAWPALLKKFKVDPTGKFFNERLEEEQLKRANFTASRRKNLESIHMDKHMGHHTDTRMENENRDKDLSGLNKKESSKKDSRETETPRHLVWNDELYQETLERLCKAYKVSDLQGHLDRWEGWYMNKFEWRKKDLQDMRKSFEAWIKDPKSQTTQTNGKKYATLAEVKAHYGDV